MSYTKIKKLAYTSGFVSLTAICLEGIASLGIEILTLRQLVPVAGTSIPVTSTAIALFLLFLAAGYYFGGSVTDNYLRRVGKNFYLAGAWAGVSLSSLTTALFFANKLPIMIQLWLYLLVCMAPPVFWLGQTVPILSNLFKMARTGEASGTALFLSTIGSFLGSLLISLVLMRYLGVSITLFVVTIGLTLMGMFIDDRKLSTLGALLGVCAMSVSATFNILQPAKMFSSQTAYADYRVVENDKAKIFLVNEQYASGILKSGENFPYIEKIRNLIDDMGVKNQEILVIGSGGFTLSQLRPGNNFNHYKYVDIDPDIAKNVVSSGFLKKINGEFIPQDGRVFLHHSNMDGKHYPVIIIDAYTSQVSVPSHLSVVEFHREIQSALSVDGVVIYNIISDPLLTTKFAQNSLASIQSVFGPCAVNVLNYKDAQSNVLVVCSAKSAKMTRQAYFDERNNVSFDLFEAR